jgi:hypothetical protein
MASPATRPGCPPPRRVCSVIGSGPQPTLGQAVLLQPVLGLHWLTEAVPARTRTAAGFRPGLSLLRQSLPGRGSAATGAHPVRLPDLEVVQGRDDVLHEGIELAVGHPHVGMRFRHAAPGVGARSTGRLTQLIDRGAQTGKLAPSPAPGRPVWRVIGCEVRTGSSLRGDATFLCGTSWVEDANRLAGGEAGTSRGRRAWCRGWGWEAGDAGSWDWPGGWPG